ncbi:MAG: zinc-binding alcohol dehydrogenase family protein [Parvularculaceae bacterium]|nr:zinc-binding alcohol dehydrogenase family protein [Parvularculaceae bacterium]
MKAIAHTQTTTLDTPNALVEVDVETPTPGPRDIVVDVRGVSVNPVDTKVRALMEPDGDHRILGWDAAGTVTAVGSAVENYKVGDEVFYAGDITRAGSHAEFQAVDERIVGRKPQSLSFKDAAALPLTAITAWEILFDGFGLQEGGGAGEVILVVGGAGGVGSIMIQLAKKLTGLTVIATASRPDTVAWVEKMGADHVINHRNPLDEEVAKLGLTPKYVAALTQTEQHWDALVKLIKPRGHIAMIDDPQEIDLPSIKPKSLTLTWEFMYTRSMFGTDDLDVQRKLLNRVSSLVDEGTLITTANHDGGVLSLEAMLEAHRLQETGAAIGKTVLDGFLKA